MNKRLVLSLVGIISTLLGLSMLLAMVVGLIYRDGSALPLALSSLTALALGTALWYQKRDFGERDLSLKDGFGIVGVSWLAASAIGSLPFIYSGSIPSFTLAFFETASGFTTTGASILEDIEVLPKGILFWRSFTHWLGGMGIIVLSVAILPYLGLGGMALFKAESAGPTTDKLRPRIQQTAKMLWLVYCLASLLCFAALCLAGMHWYESACHMFGTIATGGFSVFNKSIGHYNNATYEYIILFFMIVGGSSFTLHYKALSESPKVYLKNEELRLFLSIIVVGTLILYLTRVDENLPMEQDLRECMFNLVSVLTSTGFWTADFEQWKPLAHSTLMLAIIMGGCAGSTSGGLKIVRVLLLAKYLRVSLYQQIHPSGIFVIKMDGITVKRDVMNTILGFFFVSLVVTGVASYLLTLYGVDILTAVTATMTCQSNAGPALGDVGPAENFASIPTGGIWVLSITMILGRLEFFSLLLLFLPQTWRK